MEVLTRLEDGRDANGGADTLSKEDLPVLGCQTGHHDAEDMEETTDEDKPSRAKVVVESADDRPHSHHEKDLERGDPCDGTG